MAQENSGTSWFIHYSYQVDGIIRESSVYFNDNSEYFRYNRMRDYIQAWLNKMHEGDLNVVIRYYSKVPHEEAEEFWSNKPNESWMIQDITK